MIGGRSVLQAADDLVAAVERMEAEADIFVIGTRVCDEREDKLGTVESRSRDFPLWPIGVRWDDGSFEPCGATELRVVEDRLDAAMWEGRR